MNYIKNLGMLTRMTAALVPIRATRRRIWEARAESERLEAELTAASENAESLEKELAKVRHNERDAIREAENRWSEDVVKIFGLEIEAEGLENIPAAETPGVEPKPFVVACNHQSNLDIVVLLRVFKDHALGFLAKDDLAKIPLYGRWIHDVRSAFLDRGNAKAAVKAIGECEDYIRKGFNIAVFPEGTRAKSSKMGEFKKGSLRLAVKTGAPIIPVALEGSYRGFEEKGYPAPCKVRVKVLPPVATEGLSRHEGAEIAASIEAMVMAAHEGLR